MKTEDDAGKSAPAPDPKISRVSFISYLHNHPWVVFLMIALLVVLWGYAWVVMKQALDYMGPITFSAFRFGTGSLTMLLVIGLGRFGLPEKRHWKHFAVIGILQTAVVYSAVMYGLRFVDAGKSSVLLYSMPIWSSILAARFLGEKVTIGKMIGLVAGMAGIITIIGWDSVLAGDMKVIFGELIIIGSAFSWGISNVYYRRTLQGVSQLQVNTWQMVCGTVAIIIVAVASEWHIPVELNAHSIYYIVFAGVVASALCFTVWFFILSLIDMVTATISTLLVPIFGLLFSYLILGERLAFGGIAGSILIIVGIAIAQLSTRFRGHKR